MLLLGITVGSKFIMARPKINKRLLAESFLVASVFYLAGLGWKMLQPYFAAESYVPDILSSYSSVQYLQTETSLGIVYSYDWVNTIIGVCGFVILIVAYYGIRVWIGRAVKRKVE